MKKLSMEKLLARILLLLALITGCSSNNHQKPQKQPANIPPQFDDSLDTLDYVLSVMRFMSKNGDAGNLQHDDCAKFTEKPFESLEVNHFLNLFEENKGVASCGLASALMVRTLNDNGIDAYTYNFGFENTKFTHVVVLVPLDTKLQIFDPYLNYWITDSLGKGIDLTDIFTNQLNDNFTVRYQSQPVQADFSIYSSSLKEFNTANRKPECNEFISQFRAINDSVAQRPFIRSYIEDKNNQCHSLVKNIESKLSSSTPLKKFHQALVLKLNKISGGKNTEIVENRLDSLALKAKLERKKYGF